MVKKEVFKKVSRITASETVYEHSTMIDGQVKTKNTTEYEYLPQSDNAIRGYRKMLSSLVSYAIVRCIRDKDKLQSLVYNGQKTTGPDNIKKRLNDIRTSRARSDKMEEISFRLVMGPPSSYVEYDLKIEEGEMREHVSHSSQVLED